MKNPEFTAETYTGAISPRTYRQILANRLVLARIDAEAIDIAGDRSLLAIIDRSLTHCSGPGWDKTAAQLRRWISHGDLDELSSRLLDPRPEFEAFRVLSPLVTVYSTPKISAVVRRRSQHRIQYR
ncbi:hypothetical protein CVAR_1966 [Corynebacterium variabile DSM 44702]|uniref:Uncharacterized protein n=1 Tax=Corynebacterium variabile (strain DSM 44702 / CIP 107183 / JCM 12073 / NCIMB 30131) TaxID=858619 RepID=G0HGF0_CORVD|nr:hypothetical protein [Corynebacterium variabile]AEK37317.1 hypothetical protein CVAR_1966 [Corynebacterium variabile DSM 44702]